MRYYISLIAIAVIGISIFTACEKVALVTTNTFKSNTSATPPPAATPAPDDAPRISLAEAKKDFDGGKVLFIDTRGADQYKADHIKGSINIPAAEFEARYAEVPKDKKIIAYCS